MYYATCDLPDIFIRIPVDNLQMVCACIYLPSYVLWFKEFYIVIDYTSLVAQLESLFMSCLLTVQELGHVSRLYTLKLLAFS